VENITAQKLIEAELSELRHRLMFGREMERLGIAQDLHDGPLQEIIGISYQLQALENSMTTKADIEQLQSIQGALHLLAKSLRVICGELRPPTLIPFGLKRTILSHIDEIQTAHPELEIIQDLPPDSQSLPEQQRIVLFRIYQEALRNILQHSQATKVWVHLWIHEEQAVLEIKDNGVGFDPPRRWIEFARRGHLGMVGAMERAKEAGGSLEITSAAGQGTLIRTTVPLVVDENNQKQTMQGNGKP
jgi:signal transduction histidine kinase